ncbi:MAG: cache domain-containing protein [Planctomycetota bacterium]
MYLPRWTYSLRWRIVVSYSLILIAGGVSTALIGLRIAGTALLEQTRLQVDHDLSAARSIYQAHIDNIRQCVDILATSRRVIELLRDPTTPAYREYLAGLRVSRGLDFLSIADARGQAVYRAAAPGRAGDRVELAAVVQALRGQPAAGTEAVSLRPLGAENPDLPARAAIELAPVPGQTPGRLTTGLVQVAASPVSDEQGQTIGVVYGGRLLNAPETDVRARGAHLVVDQIEETLFPTLAEGRRHAGSATIFLEDTRVSTNAVSADGRRAVGTRIDRRVYEAVILRGETWRDRGFVVNDYYITAYEPITNLHGRRIGMLGVGALQRPVTAIRDQIALTFGGIAAACLVLIVVVTYVLTRGLTRPLEDMVAVSAAVSAGDLSRRVRAGGHSELDDLARSFNAMLDRIQAADVERYSLLEQYAQQWTEALEEKVQERTEQLARTQAAMDRHQRLAALGQLAAGVAHEINNPLGGILTFATLVQEALPVDSPIRGDVDEIVRQADRCRRIVQELLEFSRQREVRRGSHDLNDVLSRTLALLERQASFQNITVVRELAPDLPAAVIDESQMQQVFMNLIMNAVDAMGEHGTLTVQTGHDPQRGVIFARVRDTGCGIPDHLREAIFDPFFTTKAPGKGTGLGLAVVCRIVQAHGGELQVESEVERGSAFTVILPLTTPGEDVAAADIVPPV